MNRWLRVADQCITIIKTVVQASLHLAVVAAILFALLTFGHTLLSMFDRGNKQTYLNTIDDKVPNDPPR